MVGENKRINRREDWTENNPDERNKVEQIIKDRYSKSINI